jgi:hypothetical protein
MLNDLKPIELGKKYKFRTGITLAILAVMPLTLLFGLTASQPQQSESSEDLNCYNKATQNNPIKLELFQKLKGQEGANTDAIHQLLGSPYCTLPKLTIRDRAIVDRDVYRTGENVRAIVAYEDGKYLGYGLEERERSGQWWQSEPQQQIREIEVQQTWGMPAGVQIGKYRIASGLGDISLEMEGTSFAPIDGWNEGDFVLISQGNLQRNQDDCTIFSSPQMPAYLLKLCGLKHKNTGRIEQGKPLGKTDGYLHISLLSYRKADRGRATWVYVSPSAQLLESLVVSRRSDS